MGVGGTGREVEEESGLTEDYFWKDTVRNEGKMEEEWERGVPG